MSTFIDFFSFSDPNIRYVTLGVILLTSTAAIIGSFMLLQKKALVGDAVAHAVLPGVCLAFLLSGTKNPVYLVLGAFSTGWLALFLVDYIPSKSIIKKDTTIALVLSFFFGVGILLLTAIQHMGNAQQTGLNNFLFGKAASLLRSDLIVFSSISILILCCIVIFFKEFKLIAFDKDFAKSIGLPVKKLTLLLMSLTVLAIVIGLQAVGIVLMAAILITPAAAARFWTHRLKKMLLLALLFGMISGLGGVFISYTAPAMPTGPWVVLFISAIAFLSFIFAPHKGIMAKVIRRHRYQKKILSENILKLFYKLGEQDASFFEERAQEDLLQKRIMDINQLQKGLKKLVHDRFLQKKNNTWLLTEAGKQKGQRIVRIHRLWELYLTEYMNIQPDHVHEDAESIEHILTPEIEKKLTELLEHPSVDPHQSTIPYH